MWLSMSHCSHIHALCQEAESFWGKNGALSVKSSLIEGKSFGSRMVSLHFLLLSVSCMTWKGSTTFGWHTCPDHSAFRIHCCCLNAICMDLFPEATSHIFSPITTIYWYLSFILPHHLFPLTFCARNVFSCQLYSLVTLQFSSAMPFFSFSFFDEGGVVLSYRLTSISPLRAVIALSKTVANRQKQC